MKHPTTLSPTLADIARASGFSTATVSRALHGDRAVAPKTREAVLRICREMGYKPSVGGRLLAQGASAFVGLSLGETDSSSARYVSLLHQALSQQLSETGWALKLVSADDFLETISSVGAMIIIGTQDKDRRIIVTRQKDIPSVSIGYDRFNHGFSVVPDDEGGARLVARHFHKTGRKKLAIMPSLHGEENRQNSIRSSACLDEAARLGLEPEILPAINSITSTLDGYRTIMAAGNSISRFDCLFCDTDEQALGAQAALEDKGYGVPADIAVAGFDDLPVLSAHLTTVRQDINQVAATVLELVDKARRGEPPQQVVLPVELVVRESG